SLDAREWAAQVWDKTTAEFHARGPFRPLTWAHWEAAANLLEATPLYHRLVRLAWAVLSASLFLWLLAELRIPFAAAVLTTAVAMWNPYRNEIWLGLGLTEAFAMPYAIFSLICAVRAARSLRPWPWDMLGLLMALAALACKNTFVAVVPVQMFLRVAA